MFLKVITFLKKHLFISGIIAGSVLTAIGAFILALLF